LFASTLSTNTSLMEVDDAELLGGGGHRASTLSTNTSLMEGAGIGERKSWA